ncbi:MAG: HNH endonuclease signature motif containing protein [Vicinamibacterales bacterium]
MAWQKGGGKLPGKTDYSGRRRPMTRRSGYSVKGGETGGSFTTVDVPAFQLAAGARLTLTFELPRAASGHWLGFGAWFWSDRNLAVTVNDVQRYTLSTHPPPDWNKVGSLWKSPGEAARNITVTFTADKSTKLALFEPRCGIVEHEYLATGRDALMGNMYQFAPEALFIKTPGAMHQRASVEPTAAGTAALTLKSCNRCARFLPINTPDERAQLSFTNHCVAKACAHPLFGRLRHSGDGSVIQLRYGFQLECRFCKKFEVNAAHNPKRTAGQMKEDAARRRAFELLIEALNRSTPQLKYRHETGRELADDVFARFGGRCFKCKTPLAGTDWHLDHTRPLALLWPLDGTATALCGSCNSQKRDRAPADVYTDAELKELSRITGIDIADLRSPHPNLSVVRMLLDRLDWFFDEFLNSADMRHVNDGKVAGELLVKALQKVLARCPERMRVNLVAEHDRRRSR